MQKLEAGYIYATKEPAANLKFITKDSHKIIYT